MRRATRSAWVTVQRAPIPLHRRPVRRSLTGWLPRQKKRHSARSRRIHAPVIPRPSVIAGLTRNLVLKCVFGYTKARFKGLAHQPGGATVCVGQPAQGEEKADGDQRAARVGAVQGRGAPENSVAGEDRAA